MPARSDGTSRPAPAARRLTVGRLCRPCVSAPGYAPLPQVRIVGRWLESLGFHIGDQVAVEVDGGRLVLTLVGKEG